MTVDGCWYWFSFMFQAVFCNGFCYKLRNFLGHLRGNCVRGKCSWKAVSHTWSEITATSIQKLFIWHLFYLESKQIFCLFMLTVGFSYFIFLYVDIRLHVKKAKQAVKEREKRIRMYEEQIMKTQVIIAMQQIFQIDLSCHSPLGSPSKFNGFKWNKQ